jgi:hypothetical protein
MLSYQESKNENRKYENTLIINNNLNNFNNLNNSGALLSSLKNRMMTDKLNQSREEITSYSKSKLIAQSPSPTEEFNNILKQVNMAKDEYEKFAKNRANEKLVEAFEFMSKTIYDRNMRLKMSIQDNENLAKKNSAMNSDNILLSKSVIELKNLNHKLKKEIEILRNSKNVSGGGHTNNNLPVTTEYLNTNASMVIIFLIFKILE